MKNHFKSVFPLLRASHSAIRILRERRILIFCWAAHHILVVPYWTNSTLRTDWTSKSAFPFWPRLTVCCSFLTSLHSLLFLSGRASQSAVPFWPHFTVCCPFLTSLHSLLFPSDRTSQSAVPFWVHFTVCCPFLTASYSLLFLFDCKLQSDISIFCSHKTLLFIAKICLLAAYRILIFIINIYVCMYKG
jgi:hypothetical protein